MTENEPKTPPQRTHSAVDFETATRMHVALPVADLDASLAFYRALLQAEPTKVKEGYAKLEVASPPLNLSLNAVAEAPGLDPVRHFGIQVKSTAEVLAHHERMRAGGFTTMNEEGVTCCFAVQDKVWIVDPDGNRWEIFVVLDDGAEVHSAPQRREGRLPAEGAMADAVPAPSDGSRCCG